MDRQKEPSDASPEITTRQVTTQVEAYTERCASREPTPSLYPTPSTEPGAATHEDPRYGVERIERIGGGGFGEVWRVRYLGSEEAWKYIPIRPGSHERTGREAIHARRVDHPNVVRVLDALKLKDHFVLRMDLVRGRDFFRVVSEDGVLPPDDTAAYGLQVASALAHAHRQGVVHLDLKPHNLILSEDGTKVMLTDFGISASLAEELGEAPRGAGTPFFMAPEQFDTPPAVGAGIDTWSLGVTLYWMLTLAYPFRFEGREPREAICADDPIPLLEVAPHVPPAVATIVMRMLEKDPSRRIAMEEAVRELSAWREAPVDPEARAGDRAFALCLFDEAIEHYENAGGGAGEDAERARAMARLVREARSEHDLKLQGFETRLGEDDPAGALIVLDAARRRFSRSPALRSARERLEVAIRNRFAAPRKAVERELRRARFAEARGYLDRLGALAALPGARKILRAAGEEPEVDEGVVERLRASVERREAEHLQLSASVEEAVQALDFARARDILEEIQNHFPLPQHLEKMRTFARAAEHLSFLADYPRDLLDKVASLEQQPTQERPLPLVKAEARCLELLRDFDPELYPRFEEIRELAGALKEAIRSLRGRASPVVEAIQKSHRRGDLARVKRELEEAGGIILYTDIFTKDARERVRDIKRQIDSMAERADRLYREGQECLERRQFNKAITAFEEALRLGGGNHGDIDTLIRETSKAAERRRQLAEELHAMDLSASGQAVDLEDVAVFLEKAEELLQLQEDQKRSETLNRAANWLGAAVEECARVASQAARASRLESLRELAAVISRTGGEFVTRAALALPGFPEKLDALVTTVIESFAPSSDLREDEKAESGGGGETPESQLARLHQLVDAFPPLLPILSHPGIPLQNHPARKAADAILNFIRWARAGAPGREMDELARKAAEHLTALAATAPQAVADGIRGRRRRVLEGLKRRRIALGTKAVLARGLKPAIPLALALLIVGALLFERSVSAERRSAQRLLARVEEAMKDPRWAGIGGLAEARGDELAPTLRVVEKDLPAFAALDQLVHPDARFWARCLEGARILSSIAPGERLSPGRSGLQGAIVDCLTADLSAAIGAWTEEALGSFPRRAGGPARGVQALAARFSVATEVLASMTERMEETSGAPPLAPLSGRLETLRAEAEKQTAFLRTIRHLAVDLRGEDGELRAEAAGAFSGSFEALRKASLNEGWRRLLDLEASSALAEELRVNPPWDTSGRRRQGQAAADYEVLRLIGWIRETGGPLPLDPAWSPESDPFYRALEPVVR